MLCQIVHIAGNIHLLPSNGNVTHVIALGVVTETVLGLVEKRPGKTQDFGALFVKKGKFRKFNYSPILKAQQVASAACPLRSRSAGTG